MKQFFLESAVSISCCTSFVCAAYLNSDYFWWSAGCFVLGYSLMDMYAKVKNDRQS